MTDVSPAEVGRGAAAPHDAAGFAFGSSRVPALDALRGVAVLGVLAYHHDRSAVPGGWLGVSVFFTLSGFLIAGLLLTEHGRRGHVDLGSFWSRRIRRLLPASLVALGLAAVVVAVDPAQSAGEVMADLRAAVLNIANWHFIAQDAPYGGAETAPSPVQHYWSLAIEEQFYLVFPIVAAVALRRRILPLVVGAVLVGALALQVLLPEGVERVYFGTDTRAGELAAGVALALALPGLRRVLDRRHRLVDLTGWVALAATVVLFAGTSLTSDVVGAGALTAVTIVWLALLVAAVLGRSFPRLLGRGPLPPLGRISYGVYLYHWPVYLLLDAERTSLDGPLLLAVRVAVTLLLSAVSYQLVELPIRHRQLALRPVAAAAFASIAVVVAVTSAVAVVGDDVEVASTFEPAPNSRTGPTTSEPASSPDSPFSVGASASPSTTSATPSTSASSTTAAPAGRGDVTPATADPGSSGPAAPPPTAAPERRLPRLLVIGDSTANVNGRALQRAAAAENVAEVSVLHQPGCNVLRYDKVLIRSGYEYESPCGDLVADALRHAAEVDPDAIVVFLGNMQLFDARYGGSDRWRSVLENEVAEAYRAALAEAATRLASVGVPVLWADVAPAEYDPDVIAEQNGWDAPGEGEATSNDPARAARIGDVDGATLEPMAAIGRWAYTASITGPDGRIPREIRPDGIHLSDDAAERLSRSHFLPLLRDTYARVVRDMGGTGDRSPTTWTQA